MKNIILIAIIALSMGCATATRERAINVAGLKVDHYTETVLKDNGKEQDRFGLDVSFINPIPWLKDNSSKIAKGILAKIRPAKGE